jgi:hypothetical protein
MRWISIALVASMACGPKPHSKGTGSGDVPDAPGPPIEDAAVAWPDTQCGAQSQMIGVVNLGDPPDLLVVLDRSGSMNEPPPVFPPVFMSKWNLMRDALDSISMMVDHNIRFGLLEFPSDENCVADATPEVAIAINNAPPIASYFQTRSPGGNTPAHVALTSALTYYNSIPVNAAGRYVLFATDGLPNCSGGDPNTASNTETVAAVTALHAAGIPTYVLGFGTFGLNTGVLNDAAVAGGKAKPGLTKFYEANNANDLGMALQQIAGGIIVPGCSYHLMSPPPDPNNVTVTINGMAVPRSTAHTMGWDYYPDASTITFFGSYCSDIQSGAITDVSFLYGCPGPVLN